jgi:hypothetical protein
MKNPQSELYCDSFSFTQVRMSCQDLFCIQRSTEQPSHSFSSQFSFQYSRMAIERVMSLSVGALITPPGIMNDECGHCPPRIA